MNILYIGPKAGTSLHRAQALERIGHTVLYIDLAENTALNNRLFFAFALKTGFRFLHLFLLRLLKKKVNVLRHSFEVIWIDSEYLVTGEMIKYLKSLHPSKALCYVNDDPFGNAHKGKWRLFIKAISEYDLIVVFRDVNIKEAYKMGAKKVFRTYMSADEIAHREIEITEIEIKKYKSKVLFVGTYFPERGPFMMKLVSLGIPLTIYGNGWHKCKEYPQLKNYIRGGNIVGDTYSKVIASSDICLGLLSKDNRDEYTQRSLEIPYSGNLFCAQRTSEHLKMYEEGVEAEFWDTVEECAGKCFELLKDQKGINAIKKKGKSRVIENGYLNEQIADKILSEANDTYKKN